MKPSKSKRDLMAIAKRVPKDPWHAFAWFVSRCGEGFGRELMERGKTATQARNTIIGCFLDMAAGEACRLARSEGREPDPAKWRKAVDDAFERAVKRTATTMKPCDEAEDSGQERSVVV